MSCACAGWTTRKLCQCDRRWVTFLPLEKFPNRGSRALPVYVHRALLASRRLRSSKLSLEKARWTVPRRGFGSLKSGEGGGGGEEFEVIAVTSCSRTALFTDTHWLFPLYRSRRSWQISWTELSFLLFFFSHTPLIKRWSVLRSKTSNSRFFFFFFTMILIFRYPRHRKIVSFDDGNKLSISRERHSMRDIIPIIRLYSCP